MEKFQWLLNEILSQFKHMEEILRGVLARLPVIGNLAASYSNLIALAVVVVITIFVIKPLVKWSLTIVAIGTVTAAAISYFSGLTFWGVLPLTAMGAGIVVFSNKFTME